MTQRELDFLGHYRQALELLQNNHKEGNRMDFTILPSIPAQKDIRKTLPETRTAQEAHNETKKRLFRRA